MCAQIVPDQGFGGIPQAHSRECLDQLRNSNELGALRNPQVISCRRCPSASQKEEEKQK